MGRQCLVCCCIPFPQVLEHVDQVPHVPQEPWIIPSFALDSCWCSAVWTTYMKRELLLAPPQPQIILHQCRFNIAGLRSWIKTCLIYMTGLPLFLPSVSMKQTIVHHSWFCRLLAFSLLATLTPHSWLFLLQQHCLEPISLFEESDWRCSVPNWHYRNAALSGALSPITAALAHKQYCSKCLWNLLNRKRIQKQEAPVMSISP